MSTTNNNNTRKVEMKSMFNLKLIDISPMCKLFNGEVRML